MGCTALPPVNEPLSIVEPESGYRLSRIKQQSDGRVNDKRTLVLLAFSGGGTRAAALSYGVLEELRRTKVKAHGHEHTALDEVDLVVGVSGGSFTALSYGLMGERLFTEFEPNFLLRDVQGELAARVLNPIFWPRLATTGYGRSELAADYYDEVLFHGATFDDLSRLGGPMVAVSGTDLTSGARFEFTQDHFDLICSSLNTIHLSLAAATSSAVPVVLSPVTFRNRGGKCGAQVPAWVQDIAAPNSTNRPAGRALLRYREIRGLEDSDNQPYLHVVDGGVSDNLGLRGILEAFEEIEASPSFQKVTDFDKLRHIVVVVVNARSAPSTNWNKSRTPPGLLSELLQSSSVPIDHYSDESVELLKDIAQRWAYRRMLKVAEKRVSGMSKTEAEVAVPDLTFDTIDISFDALTDDSERRYFMDLPTSFHLPADAVKRLRAVAGKLLRESDATKQLLRRIEMSDGADTQH